MKIEFYDIILNNSNTMNNNSVIRYLPTIVILYERYKHKNVGSYFQVLTFIITSTNDSICR